MTSVTFPFYVVPPRADKPELTFRDAEFRYTTKTSRRLERAAGCGIATIIARGQFVESIVLMVCYGLQWKDQKMTEDKAVDLVDEFVDAGGDVVKLREACIDALNKSGVYGKVESDDANTKPEGDEAAAPLA
jgi:hypothetical protein